MSSHTFSRLLLATERSEHDRGAEVVALAMAARCGLPLAAVLPLARNAEFEMVAPAQAARADADAAIAGEGLRQQAASVGVTLAFTVRRGPERYAEIVAEAADRDADLLVTRRRGRPGLLANLLVGEMVTKVVAHAPCSVLVTPREVQGLWQRAIVLGVDPSRRDPALVDLAARIAAECGLPLHIVCVATHAALKADAAAALEGALAQARATCTRSPVAGECRTGTAHAELIAAAAAHAADLMVVGRHGMGVTGRAWIGGVAQKVIGLAPCPVLVHVAPLRAPAP